MWIICFFHPKYWLLAIVFLVCQLLVFLPLTFLLLCGNALGKIMAYFCGSIKRVADTNLGLCYPDLNREKRRCMLADSFVELGISIVETLYIWFRGPQKLKDKIIHIEGQENWQAALDNPRGIILLSCHTGSLDLNVALFHQLNESRRQFAITYKQPSDKNIDKFLGIVRKQYTDLFFSVTNLRGVCRTLKDRGIVWYAPDLETSKKGRVFVKFMGVPAATPSAIGKLAKSTGAQVLPYTHNRNDDGSYTMHFFPVMAEFPTDCITRDTQKVNDAIEKLIAFKPAAYWWAIKRFRYNKDGPTSVYKR